MSLSFPSTSALNNIRPAAFQQLAQRGGQNGSDAGTYSSNGCALSFPNDTGAMTFTEMRDIFGVLLGKPKSGWQSETDSRRFLQSMDLASAYRGRTVEFFGDLVTDGIVNANDFLFNISPILETDEMTFDFYQRDSTMMPFTEIAACGVPEEIGTQGEHFTYTWTDRVKKYEQSAKIERDLALDSNFGMTYWLDILTQFIRNAILTMKMSIITTLVQVGYTNLTRNQQLGLPLDVHKLYMSESRGFLIMAEDPEAGINMVRDVLPRVKVNMIIGPANSSRYIAKAIGEPMPTRAERFVTDSVTGQAMVKFIEGPVSAKTISLGNGHQVDYIEFEPFVLDTQSTMPINPMRTRNTLGQFHPPNPLAKADDSVKSTTGDALDMGIFYQTKSIGREERITMAQRLTNAIYWDKTTGRVSQVAHAFARDLAKKRATPDSAPWDWNPRNPNYRNDADINKETTNNSEPSMADVECKTNLHDMHSWRSEFIGVTHVPSDNSYRIPIRFGDFHMRSITHDWVHKSARHLVAKAAERLGIPDLEERFMMIERFAGALKHAEWNDAYLFALIDKNAPKMITPDAKGGFILVPDQTPTHRMNDSNVARECKFPSRASSGVDEFRQNRFGALDLPDRDPGAGIRQVYPPGFNSGAGWLTLEQESMKENSSLWLHVGREAADAMNFMRFLLTFIEEFVGDATDVINPKLVGPWHHSESKLAALVDWVIKPSGPVHMGIPDTINYEDVAPEKPVKTSKENLVDATLLRATIQETIDEINTQIRAKQQPRKPITSEERALSCLGSDAYKKMYALSLQVPPENVVVEYTKILHQLYDYIIDLCAYDEAATVDRKNIEVASIIMEAFADRAVALDATVPPTTLVDPEEIAAFKRDTMIRGLKQFIAGLMNEKTMTRTYNALKKAVELKTAGVCIDYGKGFVEELRLYEDTAPAFNVTLGKGTGARNITALPIFRADYTEAPTKWLRAPITSSQALRDYLKNKATPWILPSDSAQFYEKQEDPRIVTSNTTIDVRLHGNNFESLCSLPRAPLMQARLNANRGPVSNSFSSKSNQDNDDDDDMSSGDLFRSLKSTSRVPKSMPTADRLFSFGHSYRDNEEVGYSEAARKRIVPRVSSATGEIEVEDALKEEYFGPWGARMKYANHEIKRASDRFFFNTILLAKNRLDTPRRLAAAGAQILDVVVVRPFIETRTDAMIAVKAGQSTMATTFGHPHVQVTKESRGCYHVTCGFHLAVLRVQPDNVFLFPNAFPVSLIGGKNCDFMTDFSDWNRPNPNKPAMLGFLVSCAERKVASPMHLRNEETYIRPGIDYAIWERKLTAFGAWYEFILRNYNPENVDALHANRATYASCVPVSHVVNLGPTVYIDPQTGKKIYMEGTGPMGSFRMNWPGCQEIYEGRTSIFPYPNYNNQQL
jgi:hypothetical protein